MFARELAIARPLGTLRDSLTLSTKERRASDCHFCAGMMPENRDNGHANVPASSRLRGVDRHRDGPGSLRGDGVFAALGKNLFDLGVRARNDVY